MDKLNINRPWALLSGLVTTVSGKDVWDKW
jgi:hypothetical protein